MKTEIIRFRIAKILTIGSSLIILCSMFVVSWHVNNKAIDYIFGLELLSFAAIATVMQCKRYIPILFVVFWLFISCYSYNPYTDYLIMERYSSVKLSLSEIEEIYLLSFDDGSSTTLIKKDGKWECTGAYANKHRCKIIVWVLSGQYAASKNIIKQSN